jgi:hypothetical protein
VPSFSPLRHDSRHDFPSSTPTILTHPSQSSALCSAFDLQSTATRWIQDRRHSLRILGTARRLLPVLPILQHQVPQARSRPTHPRYHMALLRPPGPDHIQRCTLANNQIRIIRLLDSTPRNRCRLPTPGTRARPRYPLHLPWLTPCALRIPRRNILPSLNKPASNRRTTIRWQRRIACLSHARLLSRSARRRHSLVVVSFQPRSRSTVPATRGAQPCQYRPCSSLAGRLLRPPPRLHPMVSLCMPHRDPSKCSRPIIPATAVRKPRPSITACTTAAIRGPPRPRRPMPITRLRRCSATELPKHTHLVGLRLHLHRLTKQETRTDYLGVLCLPDP